MEKSISELMISKQAKRVFSEMGIERISQLQKYNWDSIDTDGSVPVECFIRAVEELMKKGFLPIPDSEVLICKSGLSTRVCNMLRSKRMLFLSHLSRYSEDEVRKFYYFGEKSFKELSGVCRRYNIQFKHGKEMEFQRKLKDMSRKQNTEISRETYNTLVEAEITDLSELSEGTVDNICRDKEIDRDCLINALDELMKKGIIPIPDNEVPLCNAGLSVKLNNILKRRKILYLSQLTRYSKEDILRFRDLGKISYEELEAACSRLGITIESNAKYREFARSLGLPPSYTRCFFDNQISSIKCFRNKTAADLFELCGGEYSRAMRLYYLLVERGIALERPDSEKVFLFEILPSSQAFKALKKGRIKTTADAAFFAEAGLLKIGLSKKSIQKLLSQRDDI